MPDVMLGRKNMARHLTCLALTLLLVAPWTPSHAQDAAKAESAAPGPVFSPSGPDAAVYGAASGFPLGTQATASQPEHLVATYSHFGEMFPSRLIKRAATPWAFKRAAEPAISYTFKSDRFS